MKKLNIIWDLDGTLIDSKVEILESLKSAIKEAGISEKDQKGEIRVGPTIDRILDEIFNPSIITVEKKKEVIVNFRNLYDDCDFNRTEPFPGIEDILINSDKFTHHILTNKPDLPVNRILKKLGWGSFFKSIRTPYTKMLKNKTQRKLSKSELFSDFKEEYADEILVSVGDMASDCTAALENDIYAIGVLWGSGKEKELVDAHCNKIVSSVDSLYSVLSELIEPLSKLN